MKPFVFALLAATALGGAAIAQQTVAAGKVAAKPKFGTFGFDETGMDRSVQPGDDFYVFANGAWTKRTTIPDDKSNFGEFEKLQDLSDQRTQGLLLAAAKDPASKIGIAYSTYLDTAAIEAKGLAPIKPWLAKIEGTSKAGLPALYAEANRNGVGRPFAMGVSQDAKDPNVLSVFLGQSGLGMPDRDYYISDDAKLAAYKTAYRAHIAKVLTLADEGDADARAGAVVDFETAIARVSWTRVQSRDADKTYNKRTLAELAQEAPGFDFAAYFKAAGVNVDTVVVGQPSAVAGIADLIGKTPDRVLKDQLIVRSLDGYSDVLPKAFDDETFAFYSNVLSGTPKQRDRWKRAVDFTNGALTDDVSKIYVAKYFPPATKAVADQMVKNIIAAMNARIDKLDWMAPETKAKAHAKLAAFTPRIGYPSQWHDYTTLKITRGDAFGNEWRANNWDFDDNISQLGGAVRRWEWGMTPMTVNAQANPRLVAITFPAAILQPPFFDPDADPAINYGGIGAVIGHEMSHHFDDQGAKYDKNGKLTQWWTDADIAAFNKRSEDLAAEYDKYEPLPGQHVQGKLTLGENSADLAGLNAAYDAYHTSLGGKPAPVIGGFTGDQRFYLGWAQVWRRSYREPELLKRLRTDPHAPSIQRTWIVRNMDAWYTAYKVQPGQKLYLAPADRVRIW